MKSASATSDMLPPPLKILRDTPTGAIYGLTTKNILLRGLDACRDVVLDSAQWRDQGRSLTLMLQSGPRVTFTAEGSSLVAECECRGWEPARHCPHVVACWALLKKVVSPESFAAFGFAPRLLRDVEILLGFKGGGESSAHEEKPLTDTLQARLERARERRKAAIELKVSSVKQEKRDIRLVLEVMDGHVFGAIRIGGERVTSYGWPGIPADLRRFMAEFYYFEPTVRYFKGFSALKGGYPILLRRWKGREIALEFRGDTPLRAGMTFTHDKDVVRMTRCLADGTPLPADSLLIGECLLDTEGKALHPFSDLAPWKLWEVVTDGLDNLYEQSGEEYALEGETLTTTPRAFNSISLNAHPQFLERYSDAVRFISRSEAADPAVVRVPSYSLEIEDDLDREVISLRPGGDLGGIPFPLSDKTFRLFSPWFRSGLSQPLRAKKRVAAMIETGFALLEATNATARDRVIRSGLGGPDFARRSVKSDARRMVKAFADSCQNRMIIILVTADGWLFGINDGAVQAGMIRLLYGFFGMDAFVDNDLPCAMKLDREVLLPRLGELAAALDLEGFGLSFRGEPLSVGKWEFSVSALADGIDWFELRPEIRCNGELLEMEEIRRLIGEGVMRQGNSVYLLADEQRRILELLTGNGSGKGKRKRQGEIVRIPRLQILDWLELRAHGVSLRLPPEEERLLAGLTRLEKIPERPLPPGLKAELRPYQKEGYDWLVFLHGHRFGACLADDMGLGKTVQTIAFLAGLAEASSTSGEQERLPHLIVVPPSLLFNWESEIARFHPSFRVAAYAGQKRSADFTEADIVLTSYGIMQRDADLLSSIPFHVAVFDEAQQVKNISAATTGAARRISARFKLALTGTPMENHLGEYFSIIDLCVPGLLGSYEEFRRRIDVKGFGGVDTLVRRTRPFVLRRSKQMIADELPPRAEADLYLEMNARQRTLYQKTVEEVKGKVSEAFRDKAPGQARMIALTAILRLRQICLCPSLINPGARAESPKLECLAEQLTELRDEGHSTLVFSQFTSFLDIVEEGLKRHKLPYIRLDGSTPVARRKELVTRFQKSDEPLIFLLSLKAGGKGLNLTRATYVYHLDPWWNPAVENQASDRAHRIGQTAKVTVTRLLMRHTVEEKMMALKERKLKLYKALLEDASGAGGVALSREDFDFLLAP